MSTVGTKGKSCDPTHVPTAASPSHARGSATLRGSEIGTRMRATREPRPAPTRVPAVFKPQSVREGTRPGRNACKYSITKLSPQPKSAAASGESPGFRAASKKPRGR
jgi:hypothetical protein